MLQKTLLTLALFLIYTGWIFSQNEPTIATCDGDQYVCATGITSNLCVIIDPSNFTEPIDYFVIEWGDGQSTTVPATGPLMQNHLYNLNNFFGTCTYDKEFTVKLKTFAVGAPNPVATATFITFINPPIAAFTFNANICFGQQLTLNSGPACPDQGLVLSWDYGDGSTGTANTHTYAAPGTYNITLFAENECGTDTETKQVTVWSLPEANAVVVDGTLDPTADTLIVCLENGGIVNLNGNNLSLNETTYKWRVILGQNSCYVWTPPAPSNMPVTPTAQIDFNCTGIFKIELKVDNPCQHPDYDTLIFKVIRKPEIAFLPFPSDCVPISLNPWDFVTVTGSYDQCSWTIGGNNFNTCDPGNMTFPQTTQVIFRATNECGTVADTSIVNITGSGNAQIVSPCSDTLCTTDPPCTLSVNFQGNFWKVNGQNASATINPANLQPGWNTITFGNPPCIQPDTIMIFVIDADVDISGNQQFCSDGPNYTFTGTPSGGMFSGSGIINPLTGEFDPSVAGAGSHTISYAYEHPSGLCQGQATIDIEVIELSVGFTIDDCEGYTVSFSLAPNTSPFDGVQWTFGDGGSSTLPSPTHTYANAGTYQVTATINLNGCTAAETNTLNLQESPTAGFNLVHDPDNCAELQVQFVNTSTGDLANYQWEWDFGNGTTSNQQNPPNLTYAQGQNDTTYTIILTVLGGCENSVYSETILVRPAPISLFGTDYNEYCSGDTIYFSNNALGNPTSWEWWIDGVLFSNDSVPPVYSHLTAMTDSIKVCLVATNECGVDTFCRFVRVNPTDVQAFFNTDPAIFCVGDTVCFTNFSTLNASVVYNFGDGNTTLNPNPCHVYSTPGQYQVVLKAFGCGFDLDTAIVTVLPRPESLFSHPLEACPGETVTFANASAGAIGYAWDFGDGATSTLVSPSHIYLSPGTYTVSLVAISPDSCQHMLSSSIIINSPPVAGFAFDSTACAGVEVPFASQAGGGALTCSYDFGDGNTSGLCNPSHIYSNPGTYTITQIVANGDLCTDTLAKQIIILTVPEVAFDVAIGSPCHPAPIQFNNLSLNADGYLWDFGDGTTSTGNNPLHVFEQPGTYSVTLTAINDGICEATASQAVAVAETPVAVISPSALQGCAPEVFTFTSNSSGSITGHEWDFGDGTFSFEENPMHTYTASGAFIVKLKVKNADCQHDTSMVITIHEPVDFEAATTNILCHGANTGAIDLTLLGGTAPFQYVWSNGAETQDIAALAAGLYSLVVTDSNGCSKVSDFTLTQPPPLFLTVLDDMKVTCFGGNDGFICVGPGGGVPGYALQWQNGSSDSCLTNIPTGDYPVRLTDANGCVLFDTLAVLQNAKIVLDDTLSHISCYGFGDGRIVLENINGGVPIYKAKMLGPNGYDVEGMTFDDLEPGAYSLTVTDAFGCSIEAFYEIVQPDSLWMYITDDTVRMELGDTYQLDISHNGNQPVFAWSPPAGLNCADCPEPLAGPFDDTNYRLLLMDGNGCTADDRVFFKIDKKRGVYIPNVFTPNGDGRNDVFRIRTGVKSIQSVAAFRIFDRWGEKVFEALEFHPNDHDPVNEWDGYFKGKRLPPDVYYYFAQIKYIDGFEETVKGDVMIAR
ncbi:MAG: PKD domain-containing protein [Saprospiraceae bacterium]|nr:PKD domain-containing protein [Saprospiraceae bacterium]